MRSSLSRSSASAASNRLSQLRPASQRISARSLPPLGVQRALPLRRGAHSGAYEQAKTPPWLYFGAAAGLVTVAGLVLRNPTAAEAPAKPVKDGPKKIISAEELAKHTTEESLWIVIDGQVWDVTEWVPMVYLLFCHSRHSF